MPRTKRLSFTLIIFFIVAFLLIGGCAANRTRPSKSITHGIAASEKDTPDITIYAGGKALKPSLELAHKIETELKELLNNDYHQTTGLRTEDPIERLKKEGIAVSYRGDLLGRRDIFVPLEWSTNTIFFDGAEYYANDKESTSSANTNATIKLPAKFNQDIAAVEQTIIESGDKSVQGIWRGATEANEMRLSLFIPNVKYQPLFYRAHMSLENISQKPIKFKALSGFNADKLPFTVRLNNPDGSKSQAVQYGDLVSSTGHKINLLDKELALEPGEKLFSHALFQLERNYSLPGAEYPYQDIEATWLPSGTINYGALTAEVKPIAAEMRITASQDEANRFYYDPINPDKVKWITMEGGFGIHAKVLSKENAPKKIREIIGMINMGTRARPSREEDGIGGMARPIGIRIQLDNGETRFIQLAYKVTKNGNATHYEPYNDRFIVVGQKENRYVTLFSRNQGVVNYLRNGWQKDMPLVSNRQ